MTENERHGPRILDLPPVSRSMSGSGRYSRRTVIAAASIVNAVTGTAPVIAQDGRGISTPATPASGTPTGTPVAGDVVLPTMPTDLPDSPVARQTAWFLGQVRAVAAGGIVDEAGLAARLHPTALAALPIPDWAAAVEQLATLLGSEAAPVAFYGTPSDQFINPLFQGADGQPYLMSVQVDVTPEALVLSFGVNAYRVPTDTYADWSELEADARTVPAGASVFVGEVDGRTVTEILSVDARRPLAIGSAFKFYVLGTLGQEVDAGSLAWGDLVAIEDAYRSFPSGVTQLLPTGTEISVRSLADHMMAISDNTATDHLIALIGREVIEASQLDFGLTAPERNVPFITTRELFTLRVGVDPTVTEEYAVAPVARRREILTEIAGTTITDEAFAAWTSPRQIDLVEWYASVEELAGAVVSVAALAADSATQEIREILSIAPGGPYDPAEFSWIGFKGGSEPGVLTLTFLADRTDGRTFVVSVGVNDDEREVDIAAVALLTAKTVASLATLP